MNNHKHHSCCHGETHGTSEISQGSDSKDGIKTVFRISGMDCAEEVALLERAVKPIAGVTGTSANIIGATFTVAHSAAVSGEALLAKIRETGLGAEIAQAASRRSPAPIEKKGRAASVAISGALTLVSLLAGKAIDLPASISIALYISAIVSGSWFIFPKAVASLRSMRLDMNALMTVAVIGAGFIGEWSEAATVTFLFGLSELLESYSVARARRAIESLLALSPDTALVRRDGKEEEVPVEEIEVSERLLIKSGAKIPLDGVVDAGSSSVNQAPITGESMPVEKKKGDQVFAGSINGQGSLEVIVNKPHYDTTLARIVHLVEEAQSQKAPSQRFVDRFAKIYTPAVMVLAMAVFFMPVLFFGGAAADWLYRSLVLLVIACPCALVISTPVSIVSALTAMARQGVLIKGGTFLEEIARLRALAVDKTGTITEGQPKVNDVHPISGAPKEEILRIAASIDSHSDHPLAQAVSSYAKQQDIKLSEVVNYQAKTGRGAQGEIDGHLYFVGNHRFTHELAVCSPEIEAILEGIESKAQSVVVVGHIPHADCKGEVLGILAVGDAIRENATEAIRELHSAGLMVIMLSGDNQKTVDAIAKQVGIDEAHGELLPEYKIEFVEKLLKSHRYVGMIGDGVNDAPAMAKASVGIAMGAAGTETAIETADIALMKDDLNKVVQAINLGKRCLSIIRFNIGFSLAIKAIFLILAMLGWTSLWLAIFADTGTSLIVIANALRLLKI